MNKLLCSWLDSANRADCLFPLNNLPYGVFSIDGDKPRCGVAIGDQILDVHALERAGLIKPGENLLFNEAGWNRLMEAGSEVWAACRSRLTELLAQDGDPVLFDDVELQRRILFPLNRAVMHMPFKVAEYTDFYSGRHHATNVGTMFRGAENALPPNWLHIPIAYNGRASSVVVSGTMVRRPWGQLKRPDEEIPRFAPSRRFDIELEMGAIVGAASTGPVSVAQADQNLFGYVLLNDWSARDIQAWEYQPLGPFQAKATATTISPWIVTAAALEPFRISGPQRDVELLPHLQEPGPMHYDISLRVTMQPQDAECATVISRTSTSQLYYCSAQQLSHHSTAGCPMNSGDLLGSGTISGAEKNQRGSLLEISWGGKEPFTLDTGEQRSFIEDNDTLMLSGVAEGDGYRIGFGECAGTVLPALRNPFGV